MPLQALVNDVLKVVYTEFKVTYVSTIPCNDIATITEQRVPRSIREVQSASFPTRLYPYLHKECLQSVPLLSKNNNISGLYTE